MIVPRALHSLRLGCQSLLLHKLRSLLTILGVVFGVGSVIVMLAIAEGARAGAVRAINELGVTNLILQSVKPPDGDNSAGSGAIRYGLTQGDLAALSSALSTIHTAAPMRAHRREVRRFERSIRGRVLGVTPDYFDVHHIRLVEGRLLDHLDSGNLHAVAMLSQGAAEALFPLANPLGKDIRIGEDQYYQVVGIVSSTSAGGAAQGDALGDGGDRDVYIPFPTDQQRFGETVKFDRTGAQLPEKLEISRIVLSVYETHQVKPTARVVESILQERHARGDVVLTIPLELLEKTEQTQRIFTWVLTSIACVSLLVGGIGIMNIMLATVTERTREIGVRRALGAKRRHILTQFLIETIVLSSLGGVLGVGLGFAGAHFASRFAEVEAVVRPEAPLLAMLVAMGTGVVFGVYPARRAAYMDPIEALRHD